MLISFIVYIETNDYKGQLNRILRSVKGVKYPKSKIEFIIFAKAANASQIYKIDGPPLVRIFPTNNINDLLDQCHGDIIFLIDERFSFPINFFNRNPAKPNFVGKGYCGIWKSYIYPYDCFCVRTASIMKGIGSGRPFRGRWGRINRKEGLRIIYKWDEISNINRIKLLWGLLCGAKE